MSSSHASTSSAILSASFNQTNTGFAVGTREGFKVFDVRTGRLCTDTRIGAFSVVEMLFSTNMVALVGAGEQPSLSPRRLCLFDLRTGLPIRELNFLTSILAVRLNRKRLIVVLQDKTYIYDAHSLAILDEIGTIPNTKGLCAFSPNSEGCFLALPASKTKGSVLIYNTMELYSVCEIDAHQNPLAAIAFSSNGMYMATASEHGTIIRVHLVSQATKSYSFRRGSYTSTVYSLSFGPSAEMPDILVATSLSGSMHVFLLGSMMNQKISNGLLGSVFPKSINNALESANHHVLHNAVPPGIRSYSMVRSIDKSEDVDKTSNTAALRTSIVVIDQNGHFWEYSFTANKMNESFWNLERHINLLTSDTNTPSFVYDN